MKSAIDFVPLGFRSVPVLHSVLDYDERPYPLCPRCKFNVTRTFLCRKCLKDAVYELDNTIKK